MNRSKPSTVVGGGEMKRDTSSVESIARSEGASESRSSRSVTIDPVSTGSACRQSLLVVVDAAAGAIAAFMSTSTSPSR
jgi:hypothetical protein